MKKIEIDGKKYRVTESLGFQGGFIAKAVETPDGEKIAVRRLEGWTFWTAANRIGRES